MTYHSELSRNFVTFSEVSLLKISMNDLTKVFFPDELKCAFVPVYKKKDKNKYRPVSIFCLIYQNSMKGVCINKSMTFEDHSLLKIRD